METESRAVLGRVSADEPISDGYCVLLLLV